MLTNVPWMNGAMTLGSYQLYGADSAPDSNDIPYHKNTGHTVQQHEDQHVIQSNLLGPLYLPFALAGMAGLIRDGDAHGPHAFSESGPSQVGVAQPWPKKWW